MTIEILSIGNELLTGQTINSNAATIARELLMHGFSVERVTVLPDAIEPLKKGIEEALSRASIVITTGGLGPTGDDLTRAVVAEVFGTSLVFDKELYTDLKRRFGENNPTLEDQALVLQGATIMTNPLGTAPGFILEGRATIIILPGVPSQMAAMLDQVTTYLEANQPKSHYISSLYLCQLSESQVDPYLRILEKEYPGIQIGICPSYGVLSIYLQAPDPNLLPLIEQKITEKYIEYCYSHTDKQIEKAIQNELIQRQQTLACAESCTGGRLATLLTIIPGASAYFFGRLVSYSNPLKEKILGVSPATLQEYGAVSQKTVVEMAYGAKRLTSADYVIAVSGIAGPTGGTPQKPVGTIWAAIATPDQLFSGSIPARASVKTRELIIDYSTTYLLTSLWRFLKHNIEPFA